jgi:hypothetical protein
MHDVHTCKYGEHTFASNNLSPWLSSSPAFSLSFSPNNQTSRSPYPLLVSSIFAYLLIPWLCSSKKDLGHFAYGRQLKLFKHPVGLLGRVVSSSKGLCLHRTGQYRKRRKEVQALSGIRTHDPNVHCDQISNLMRVETIKKPQNNLL